MHGLTPTPLQIPAVNRAVMKQVLQRSGLIEIVKLPEDSRRRAKAVRAGAANDNHISRENKRDNSVAIATTRSSGDTRAAT